MKKIFIIIGVAFAVSMCSEDDIDYLTSLENAKKGIVGYWGKPIYDKSDCVGAINVNGCSFTRFCENGYRYLVCHDGESKLGRYEITEEGGDYILDLVYNDETSAGTYTLRVLSEKMLIYTSFENHGVACSRRETIYRICK